MSNRYEYETPKTPPRSATRDSPTRTNSLTTSSNFSSGGRSQARAAHYPYNYRPINVRRRLFSNMPIAPAKLLDPRTISRELDFLGTGLIAEDITNPTSERMEVLYRQFAISVLRVHENSLNQLPFSASHSDGELYQKTTSHMLLFKIVGAFYCDFFDRFEFTIMDIVAPKPKKTRELLSCMVHYCRHYHRFAPEKKAAIDACEDAIRQVTDGEKELDELDGELAQAKRDKDMRKRRENQLAEEKHKTYTELTELINTVKEALQKIEHCENTVKNCDSEKEQCYTTITSLQETDRYLAEEIIDAPDERTTERNELREVITNLRRCLEENKKMQNDLKKSEEHLKQVHVVNEDNCQILAELSRKKDKLDVHMLDQVHANRAVDEQASALRERESLVTSSVRRRETEKEEHALALENHLCRIKQMQEEKIELEQEVRELSTNQGEVNSDLKQTRQELRGVKARKSEFERSMKDFKEKAQEKLRKVIKVHDDDYKNFIETKRIHYEAIASIDNALSMDDLSVNNMSITFSRPSLTLTDVGLSL